MKSLRNVMLCFASCLLSLVIMEVALWVYNYNSLRSLRPGNQLILQASHYPGVKYELIPGASGLAWGANETINSHGFRGPEPTPGKYTGYRILLLGDSITFANMLPVEATFAHLLQQLLQSEAQEFEVLNFGVDGYDTLQEVAQLKFRGLKYHPDLVIVAYCLNDIAIVSLNLFYLKQLQAQQNNFLFRFRLPQLVANRLGRTRLRRWYKYMNSPEVFRQEYEDQIDTISSDEVGLLSLMENLPNVHPSIWYKDVVKVGRLRFSFRILSNLAKQNGFSVVVLIIPALIGDAEKYPYKGAHRIVELEARRVGFDTIDFIDQFAKTGMKNLRIDSKDHVHPNKVGHAMIAEALSKYIRAKLKKGFAALAKKADYE